MLCVSVRGVCFSDGEGGFISRWGGGIDFDEGVQKKLLMGGYPPMPSTVEKPVNGDLIFFSEIQK